MPRSIGSNIAGVWKTNLLAAVNVGGVWKSAKGGWTNVAGVWQKFYPEVEDGTVGFESSSPGSGNIVVPNGITRARIRLIGGGGGGAGGSLFLGIIQYCGGAGGSGGKYFDTDIAVVPGATMPYTIGSGGAATSTINGGFSSNASPGTASTFGGLTATGGGGGFGSTTITGGAGGTPSGVNGSNGLATTYTGFTVLESFPGGNNGSGYGKGGYGGFFSLFTGIINGLAGQAGHLKVTWFAV